MEERANQKMSHRVFMTDRKKIELTGIMLYLLTLIRSY